jgi:APA family basic amino acid/polyamine antiporter
MNGSSELKRDLGLGDAVLLGMGSILGTGVFVSLGIAAGVAGSALLLAVFLAFLVATANALSSAQLAAANPVSGGTYAQGYKFLNPTAGFMAGWMYLVAKSASAATAILGFSGYLLHLFDVQAGRWLHIGIALVALAVLTVLCLRGIRRSSKANAAIVFVTLIALIAFIVAGSVFLIDGGGLEGPVWEWGDFGDPRDLFEAVGLVFVAYAGYGRICTLGEEVHEPSRTIPRAVITTLLATMVLYVGVATVALATVGPEAFAAATGSIAAPLEVIAKQFQYPAVAGIVAVGAVTAMAGVVLNLLLGLSRVLFAMGREGDMPSKVAEIDERHAIPGVAVIVMAVVIAAIALVGDVRVTWSFSAFAVLIYYGTTNVCALRLSEEQRRFPRWIAVFGVIACFALAFFIDWYAWLLGLGLLLIGFALRWFVRRSS